MFTVICLAQMVFYTSAAAAKAAFVLSFSDLRRRLMEKIYDSVIEEQLI